MTTSNDTKSAGQSASWAEAVARRQEARQRVSKDQLMVEVLRSEEKCNQWPGARYKKGACSERQTAEN